jgi:hypothetical protein
MIFGRISGSSTPLSVKSSLKVLNYEPLIQYGQKPPLLRKHDSYNPKIRKGAFKWLKFTAFLR